jgi:hypothetical protein
MTTNTIKDAVAAYDEWKRKRAGEVEPARTLEVAVLDLHRRFKICAVRYDPTRWRAPLNA